MLDSYAETVIGQMNATMKEVVTAAGYEIVDTHAVMVGQGAVMSNIMSADIHPNALGHAKMAEMVKTYLGIGVTETTQPAETTAEPEDTTPVPDETTTKPAETTAEPEETSTAPAVTTTVPAVTTTLPEVTTAKPAETTKPAATNPETGDTQPVALQVAIALLSLCAVAMLTFRKKFI